MCLSVAIIKDGLWVRGVGEGETGGGGGGGGRRPERAASPGTLPAPLAQVCEQSGGGTAVLRASSSPSSSLGI